MKKVIDSHGNELEIGKVYEFSSSGEDWRVDVLQKFDGSKVPFKSVNIGWTSYIRECQSTLGTIKKAPVKLVDGKAYQFEMSGAIYCGFFNEIDECLCVSTEADASVIGYLSVCKNIIPLVAETKQLRSL